MHPALLIQPDSRFIHDIMVSGGEDLKKCMQCGTCSAICSLAPEDGAFPRKQMLEAQWGLKDRLVGDPAIWLCHNCGDCTTYCPRGARPGDVFNALRQQAIEHFAFPGFLGRLVGSSMALPILLLLPALIFWAIARLSPASGMTQELEFASVFPIPVLEALFFALSGLVLVIFWIGLVRFIKALRDSGSGSIGVSSLAAALVEIMAHKRFSECTGKKSRRTGHLLTLWGFAGLAVTGTVVGIGSMAGILRTPLALTSPWKILANLSAVAILVGCLVLLVDRIQDPVRRAATTYFDWFFLLTLTGVVVTGIVSEVLRLGRVDQIMFGVYFVHLVLVFSLFLYAPYSKFAHIAYRTVAMAAARGGAGRNGLAGRRQAAADGVIRQ
ncbi:MAG: quinone-interacting rane-bound oxidoreductase complex subunit QmoC [Acidobacteria bacterium]|nr:quinone-interacting rane-bound oxidoreductase complex subunit QmoC [Acidobacteriota bacterium]